MYRTSILFVLLLASCTARNEASSPLPSSESPAIAANGLVSPPADAINVMDYGATGDGSTNDADAINRAVAAAGVGSTVYFPPGRYVVADASIDMKTGVTYLGDPGGGTTIAGSYAMSNGNQSDGPHDVTIEQLTFDGNGLLFYNVVVPDNITVINNSFVNGSARSSGNSDNCGVVGSSTAILSTIGFSRSLIANNYFYNLFLAPPFDDPYGANWNCQPQAILVENELQATTITANRFDEVGQAIGIYMSETADPSAPPEADDAISNNYITNTERMGIEVQGAIPFSPLTISGNYVSMILTPSGQGIGNEIGISIAVGGTGHQITDNAVITSPPLSGAAMELMGTGFLSQGNYVSGWANAQLIGCTDGDCGTGYSGTNTWVSQSNTFCDFTNDYNLEYGGHAPAIDHNTDSYASCDGYPPPSPPAAGPATGQTTSSWIYCAAENAECSFSGVAQVQYGANGHYVYQTFTGGTLCANSVFGDPDYGVAKSCAYMPVTSSGPAPGNYYIRPHASSAKALDVTGASTAAGTAVEIWDANNGANQIWTLRPVTGGYQIVSVGSGLCLDLDSASTANGVHLEQNPCSSSTGQTFSLTPIAGSYQIENAFSGNCIDSSGDLSDGTLPEEWTCVTSYTNQYWDFDGA